MRRYILTAAVMSAAATLTGLAPAGTGPARAAVTGTRAAPGAQLWVAREFRGGEALAMAVAPGGRRVYVTGYGWSGRGTGQDYATAAYDAATGRRLWARLYNGSTHAGRNLTDDAYSVAVSPGGRRVFVTGQSVGRRSGYDYATVAYSAATGRQLWVSRYNGPANGDDSAESVAVGPGGRTVFVTGQSAGRGTRDDYATVAYGAATGRQRWVSRYNGPANGADFAASVAVSPAGNRVFVTGGSKGLTTGHGYATVAYGAATGRQLWVSRYSGPWKDEDPVGGARSVAVSPDGTMVYVTGIGEDRDVVAVYATVAYSAADGARRWVSRYNPGSGDDVAASVAVSPDGTMVYVTGTSGGRRIGVDYATIAYRG